MALGLIHLLITTGRFDERFVRTWTNGSFLVRGDTGRLLRESDLRPDGSPSRNLVTRAGTDFAIYDGTRGRWLDDEVEPALRWAGAVDTLAGPIPCQTAFESIAEMAAEYPPERSGSPS